MENRFQKEAEAIKEKEAAKIRAKEYLKLDQFKNYLARFYDHLSDENCTGQNAAFEQTEKDYKEIFGRHKFKNFPSFRTVRSNYLTKLRKSNR